jgi:gamma-glutamyltranspeptidase/glutathione hydrolase
MPTRPLVPGQSIRGSRGAVVTAHHLATAAGLQVLADGGHAVDAAIAANACLAVVVPFRCGIGGDAFWLIWDEAAGTELALNGSGRAPAGANADALLAMGHDTMPFRGPHPITVPGAVRSWGDAHRRFGRLSPERILAPAIELAEHGFPASEAFSSAVERSATWASAVDGSSEGWFAIYRPAGRPWRAGEIVRLPALATTLSRLASHGFDDFYEGDLAERTMAGLARVGSPMTLDDLRSHTSTWGEPIGVDYRGVRVTTHPPNSQGFVALEVLGILERFEPPHPSTFLADGRPDPGWIHRGIEAAKLAMHDRDGHLTDPEFRDVPIGDLLAADRLDELAARIDPNRAALVPASTTPLGGGTMWLGVADVDGNGVSLIESNYHGFGSLVVDPATGIHFHNRGSFFSLDPDHPNVIEPRKRTLHTLMPTMWLRDGKPWMLAGTRGGDAQPQIVIQVASEVIDGGADLATALAAPRWYVEPETHFAPPVHVRAEARFTPEVIEALTALGHPVSRLEPFDDLVGDAHAIEFVDGGPARDGSYAAATDPRSEGLPGAR